MPEVAKILLEIIFASKYCKKCISEGIRWGSYGTCHIVVLFTFVCPLEPEYQVLEKWNTKYLHETAQMLPMKSSINMHP